MEFKFDNKANNRDAGALARRIGEETGLKLIAETENDSVEGHVTIINKDVLVVIYEEDKTPTETRKSTLKKVENPQVHKERIEGVINETE